VDARILTAIRQLSPLPNDARSADECDCFADPPTSALSGDPDTIKHINIRLTRTHRFLVSNIDTVDADHVRSHIRSASSWVLTVEHDDRSATPAPALPDASRHGPGPDYDSTGAAPPLRQASLRMSKLEQIRGGEF